jgi:hypothetical protein
MPEAIKAIFFNIFRSLSKMAHGFKEMVFPGPCTLNPVFTPGPFVPFFIGEFPYKNTGSSLF